jgi:hypothetical protein
MAVADCLGPLLDQVVFVGGSIVGLLITNPAAPDVRPTDDVDVIVEIATYGQYAELQEKLGESFTTPIGDTDFIASIEAHLPPDAADRVPIIHQQMKELSTL